jgi:N-acetylmuramoyl-L-alanine amidase
LPETLKKPHKPKEPQDNKQMEKGFAYINSTPEKQFLRGLTVVAMMVMFVAAGCVGNRDNNLPAPTVRPTYIPRTPSRVPSAPRPQGTYPNKTPDKQNHPWAPSAQEDFNRWRGIVIHHSADDFGDAASFDQSHKQRGWRGLGYHFVINNGNNRHGKKNGEVEVGFRWTNQEEGAHCRVNPNDDNYWNEHTIGICLVGNFQQHRPSEQQYRSLAQLVRFLQQRYNIPTSQICGHGQVPGAKTKCPGKYFSWETFKQYLQAY